MLSKKCAHAIRAMMQLTLLREADPGSRVKAAELAALLDIPAPMMSKVLHALTEHKLVKSFKGPSGGVQLHGSPSSIQILDVVSAIEGDDAFHHCIMGFEHCSSGTPCPMHDLWKRARSEILHTLADIDLSTWCRSRHAEHLSLISSAQVGAGI